MLGDRSLSASTRSTCISPSSPLLGTTSPSSVVWITILYGFPYEPVQCISSPSSWRAACGFPRRVCSRDGSDITAVFGFFALLRKTHREGAWFGDRRLLRLRDGGREPRTGQFPGYKARPAYPRDFTPFEWLATIQNGLDLLSVSWCEVQSWEADDDIASLVRRLHGRRAAIMPADHDFLQLVGRRVRVVTPRRAYRVADVIGHYAVHPSQWCDFRALMGDPSDNIPGVRGVGPKWAAQVLRGRRTLEWARVPNTWWGGGSTTTTSRRCCGATSSGCGPSRTLAWIPADVPRRQPMCVGSSVCGADPVVRRRPTRPSPGRTASWTS